MDREKALKFWDEIYGPNNKWQVDCFGVWMYRDDYGDVDTKRARPNGDGKKYSYGWEIDHIRPKSDFDNESNANFKNNYEPMHWQNNRDKGDQYPQFFIDNKKYIVVKCSICKNHSLRGYGIENDEGKRIDWKYKTNSYFGK